MSDQNEAPRSVAQERIEARLAMLRAGPSELNVTDTQKRSIIELVEHGATVAEIERLEGMPSSVTIWRESKRDPAFGQALQEARVVSASNILDEAQHQLRRALETNDPDNMRVAADYAKASTVYAEKIAPKEFGAMLKHAGADGGPLQVVTMDYASQFMGKLREVNEMLAREETNQAPALTTKEGAAALGDLDGDTLSD